QPQLVIIVETEIWPNFCRQAKALGIPLVLVNGRISDRSFPRYRKLRFLLKPVLESFSAFCMQTQVDAERISTLGAENIRVENTGNLKFDHELIALDESEIVARKNLYRLPDDAAILVAGSTHDGEEKLLCDAYRTIAPRVDRSLVMVLIPRHPERKQEVAKLLKDAGLECRLRTALSPEDELSRPGSVLVIDTLGEVLDLYSVADLVFVGGSLVPVGGHNLLEASLLAKPVLFGPHVHNFREIATKLVRAGAGIRVEDNAEFVEQSVTLLRDSARSRAMGEAGRALIVENSGATERTMKHVSRYLNF
ncbi:MAG: 3-deoxy-D-manno-octulosonic acid transferase, partial [Desulfuromonas sp.]